MSGDNLEFKWGTKVVVSRSNRELKFYDSFIFDGVEYKLADCVYMWKDEEPEPFVGKIIRIFQDKSRKVKIHWFFKPDEISNYLGDLQVYENELFLASGEGVGLANVNPLEAIAGKCNVVCISKDDRNPQPSTEELEAADYVFYRTFDVGQLIVSDTIPQKIPGIDIKFIFNQRVGQSTSLSTRNGTELILDSEGCLDRKENEGRINSQKISEDVGNTVRNNSHLPDRDDGNEMSKGSFKKRKTEKDDNDQKLNIQSIDLPTEKSVEDKKSSMPLNVSNDLVRMPSKVEAYVSNFQVKGKSKLPRESTGIVEAVLPAKRKIDEEVQRAVNSKRLKASDHTLNKQSSPSRVFTQVTRKPDVDRSRWFKELPWEERMENAHQQGALVLLQNLDPSYSSSDVEDIIRHGFKESCTANILYCVTNFSPLSGKAFVVFKTKVVAEKIVTRLDHGCLMLSNGRPLIGSFGNPCIPRKEKLVGHFGIDKLSVQLSREKKEAVSTSHCSQTNSIEYEFAMDWCLLQERYNLCRILLQKQHTEDLKKAMANLKTRLT